MAVVVPGKFVYLATPHTGSMSTTRALLDQVPGAQQVGSHHAILDELHVEAVEAVTTVRNPFDMIVTWWLRTDARTRYGSFKEFLRDYDDPTYVKDGRIFYHCGPGVRVLRFENLAAELTELITDHGLEPVELPWINKTQDRKPWRDYYDEEALEIVRERFGAEIANFGYGDE